MIPSPSISIRSVPTAGGYFGAGLLLGLLLACPARGQTPELIQRLPPIDLVPEQLAPDSAAGPVFRLATDPYEYRTPQDVLAPELPDLPPPPTKALEPYKKSFFQKASLLGTYLFPDGSDGVGITEIEVFAAFALPAPTTEMPLILIPTFQWSLLDGPPAPDLPPELYAASFDFMWLPRFSPRWSAMLSVSPGWYSDFAGGTEDAFRLTGRAIARYDVWPEQLQLVLGVLYLDRLNTELLPVGGVIWNPSDDWNCELVFPRAKLGRRLGWGPGFENWVYLTGGFGGNTWAITNGAGQPDELDMLDWRFTLGWEQKRNGGAGLLFEAGYVFGREFEFASGPAVYSLDDTLLLRAGAAF